jgi:hypothetical protein
MIFLYFYYLNLFDNFLFFKYYLIIYTYKYKYKKYKVKYRFSL